MIRTVLVDDEPPARRKLAHLLSTDPEIEIVGEAGSGAEAIDVIKRVHPDLVFLDIGLPDSTGFDVIDSLESRDDLYVVFVTAYDEFALKAFEVHALDYLLKPVEPSRFAEAMVRVRHTVHAGNARRLASRLEELVTNLRSRATYARRLLIQENERSLFLDVSRIDWIEAARNYTCIHCGAQTHIQRSSLEALLAKLDPAIFRRINRSEAINVERIAEVRAWFHGDQKVFLIDGTELTWSRRYRLPSLEELEKV